MKSPIYCAVLLMAACVNQVEEDAPSGGKIPISFAAKINQSATTTKVTDTAFESGDEIGLFATISGTSIDVERYIDNLKLVCQGGENLIPEEDVFYPEGGVSLDFTAYYPYQANALQSLGTTLQIAVDEDQSEHENYSKSDFLVAAVNGVEGSTDPVTLKFEHALSKLKIELLLEGDGSVEDMLNGNPVIVACGLYTQAEYDFKDGTLKNLSASGDVVAYGEWKEESGKLTGKELIVIPQQVDAGAQFIAVELDGRIYTCPLSSFTLEKNTQRTIQITMNPVSDDVLTGMVGSIEPWDSADDVEETTGSVESNAVHVSTLSFASSNIYRVYLNGQPVAEICKEYLLGTGIDAQAIVVYPMENQTSDFTQGKVLELLGNTENVHGGTVSWNSQTKALTYRAGTSAPITQLYITQDGDIAYEKPETAAQVIVSSYLLKDARDGSVQSYPLVKIGMQYWMQENLKATAYRDGTPLSKQTKQDGKAAYYQPDGMELYFYSGEAILANTLAPKGWRIPTTGDWEQLQSYVQDVAVLKVGEWEALQEGESVKPATNKAYFNGYPVGLWSGEKHISSGMLVGFWTLEYEGGTFVMPEETFYLRGEDEEFVLSSTESSNGEYYKVLAIRCVKDE